MSKPTRFEDLDVKELRRSAIEDFAVPVENNDNKRSVIAALAEGGVQWVDYVKQHPEVAPEPEIEVTTKVEVNREPEPDRGNVVTSDDVLGGPVEPVTAAPVVADGNKPWLIKMVRDNVRFDVRGYTFTQQHPYALVKPEDVPFILEREDGFRQAYPTELQEFYAK